MQTTLTDQANQVANHMVTRQGVPRAAAFDPATIFLIISIIVSVIKLIRECKKTPSKSVDLMHNPGIFASWRLRRLCKRAMTGHQDPAFSHSHLVSGILYIGRWATVADYQNMLQESSS